uniref:DUF5641 domain-containing protein n=1 Tax=Anopheles dirus TaxID=7168 RepID=A0A182NQ99_9DIPT
MHRQAYPERESLTPEPPRTVADTTPPAPTPASSVETCNTHSGTKERALLKYVPIVAYGPRGSVKTYAFVDDGSSATFMDRSLFDELGLVGTSDPLCLKWTGGITRNEENSKRLNIQISGRNGERKYDLRNARTVKNLDLPIQTVSVPQLAVQYAHLRGLPVSSYHQVQPRLLIGVDNSWVTRALKTAERRNNEPLASKTRLGWTIHGSCPIAENSPGNTYSNFHMCLCDGVSEELLNAELKKLFSLEAVGGGKPVKMWRSKENEKAMVILERETVMRENRFETGLLWKLDEVMTQPLTPNHILLGSSDGSKPPIPFCGEADAADSSWKASQYIADVFWKRWIGDYLPVLAKRTKWFDAVKPIRVGDLVIVIDNNLPCNCWPKGLVEEVLKAKDGQVRQALVRTSTGLYKRPSTKLAIVETMRIE